MNTRNIARIGYRNLSIAHHLSAADAATVHHAPGRRNVVEPGISADVALVTHRICSNRPDGAEGCAAGALRRRKEAQCSPESNRERQRVK
jgi:hypothetical protein